MISIFKDCNFDIEVVDIGRWQDAPTSRQKLNETFKNISDEELLIADFDIVLQPV